MKELVDYILEDETIYLLKNMADKNRYFNRLRDANVIVIHFSQLMYFKDKKMLQSHKVCKSWELLTI